MRAFRSALACALLWTGASLADEPAQRLIRAAREQIGVTVTYDGSYRKLAYPGGDVPADRGVCTDVLVRAYRRLGLDLQVLVHEDMKARWPLYPKLWGLRRPDPNIDHRRVPNLATFFSRHGSRLRVSRDPRDYESGDLVTWMLPGNLPHIGILGNTRSEAGALLVIHNIGRGAAEENILFSYPVTGRFRYLLAASP